MKYEELVYRILYVLTKDETRCKEYLKKGKLVMAIPDKIPYKMTDAIWEIKIEKKNFDEEVVEE